MKTILFLTAIAALMFGCAQSKKVTTLKTFDPYLFESTYTAYKYYVDGSDSFLISYALSGSYMSPLVARFIFDVDSTITPDSDTTNPFWRMKNLREDTAAYRKERHYYAHIQVYSIKGGNKTAIGDPMSGYYVEDGCYEDVPENWVTAAKKSVK